MRTGWLKLQSCKLYINKYMIASTQIKNTEVFTFIAVLVFKGTLMQIWKSPCLQKTFSRRVEDVSIKTTALLLSYVFRRRLQDSLIKKNIFILVIRLQDVFTTFSRHLQNVFKKSCQDVFKTSSGRLAKMPSRRFRDVSSI